MSHTLIMRLTGPMQSWGVSSRFTIRETLTEPTKSGVLGIICCALGWDRNEESFVISGNEYRLEDLASLNFGIRVLREGLIRSDFHTAQNVLRAKAKLRPGKKPSSSDIQDTVTSDRYYLSNAYFLAGIEADDKGLLEGINTALESPHWPLSLGRKAFSPSLPLTIKDKDGQNCGVLEDSIVEALLSFDDPLFDVTNQESKSKPGNRLIIDGSVDVNFDEYHMVQQTQVSDVPLSFSPRKFIPREVSTYIKN